MHPLLFKIPGLDVPIYTYGFMIMLGFLGAIGVAVWRGKQKDVEPDTVLDLGLVLLVSGILGARLTFLGSVEHNIDLGIFQIFDRNSLNPIAVLLGAGLPIFWFWRRVKADKPRLSSGGMALLAIAIMGGGVVVGRLGSVLMNRGQYSFEAFAIWKGGIVLYGGLIAATLCGIGFIKWKGVSVARMSDLAGPSVALGIAFGRVGCFLNGCCWGKVCGSGGFLCVQFPRYSDKIAEITGRAESLPLHEHIQQGLVGPAATLSAPVYATQLMEASVMFLTFGILLWLSFKLKREGMLLPLFAVVYSAWRFVIEFYRGDNPLIADTYTFSQWTSFFVAGAGILFVAWLAFKPLKDSPVPMTDAIDVPAAEAGSDTKASTEADD